jgi:hypothetical protein
MVKNDDIWKKIEDSRNEVNTVVAVARTQKIGHNSEMKEYKSKIELETSVTIIAAERTTAGIKILDLRSWLKTKIRLLSRIIPESNPVTGKDFYSREIYQNYKRIKYIWI